MRESIQGEEQKMTDVEEDKLEIMTDMLDEFRKMAKYLGEIANSVNGIEMQLQDLAHQVRDGVKTYEQND